MIHAVAAAALAFPLGGGTYTVPPQAVPPPSLLSAAAAGRSFGGHTSEADPIAIRVRGRRVQEIYLELHAPCDSQMTFPVATGAFRNPGKRDVPELKDGRISKKGKFTATSAGAVDVGNNQVALVQMGVTGKLGKRRSSGAVAVDVSIVDTTTNQQVDHCSGQLPWSSSVPERRVYSGSTKQATPVVLELNRKRSSISSFWFGLFANCTPDGFIAPSDFITNFKIRKGRFGDDFSDDVPDGAGGSIHLDFKFHGRISRASAHGTIDVTATERDAQGNVTGSCPSGSVGWTARQ